VRVDAGSPSKWRATFEVLKLTESSAFSHLFLSRSRWPAFEGSDKHWWSGPLLLSQTVVNSWYRSSNHATS